LFEVKEVLGFLAEEDVGENWLEDDMASTTRPNKKRRLAAPIEKHRCIGSCSASQEIPCRVTWSQGI
jgi:hypothetical protein